MPDPHQLTRFVQAQQEVYTQALSEIRAGEKQSHWMWFIFPQFDGLGHSSTSRHFAIKSRAEAEAYLAHPILGPRLLECAAAALAVQDRSACEIFGSTDYLKFRSSATLFAQVAPPGSIFQQLLDKYFKGERDEKTRRLLAMAGSDEPPAHPPNQNPPA